MPQYQDPPKKSQKSSPIAQALQKQISPSFYDTLSAIAGRQFYVDTLPNFMKGGVLGSYPQASDRIEVLTGMSDLLARETAIHETGHLTVERTKRLPEARTANLKNPEGVARAFMRAYAALGATRADTTNSAGVIEQFAMGIHPSLSHVERRRGYIPGTERLLGELLALPIFAQHPLRSRQAQIMREAPSIR